MKTLSLKISTDLIENIKNNKGATLTLDNNEVRPKFINFGFMTSYEKFEKISKEMSAEVLENFIRTVSESLNENDFIGVWEDYLEDGTSVWYLDVSTWFLGKEEAMKFAKDNRQIAIWDCRENSAINVLQPELTFSN